MAWNTSEKALELFKTQVCCTVFVYLSTSLRFWAQSANETTKGKHAIHDKLMYISVLLYTAQVIVIILGIVRGGIGQHGDKLSETDVVNGFQAWYFGELIYATLSCIVKTSVVMYLRQVYLLKVHRPLLAMVFIFSLASIWATSVAFFFVSIFQCSPVGYYWSQFRPSSGTGTCHKDIVPVTGIVLSIVLALSDWALSFVPVTSLWNARLPWQTKVAIQALTSLGVLAGAAMIIRIPYIKMLEPSKDFLYETVDVAKWTVIEATLGIVAACLPTIWPLFRMASPRSVSPRNFKAETPTPNCEIHVEGGLENGTILHDRKSIIVQRHFHTSVCFTENLERPYQIRYDK